jgi:dTDP-6-deoxy-L-talose 4-dehydrogenase (NAD+)
LDEGIDVVATDYKSDYIDERAVIKECDLFIVANPYDYFEHLDAILHLAWRNGITS